MFVSQKLSCSDDLSSCFLLIVDLSFLNSKELSGLGVLDERDIAESWIFKLPVELKVLL